MKQSEELATAKMQRNGPTEHSPTAVMTSDKIIQSPALLVIVLIEEREHLPAFGIENILSL